MSISSQGPRGSGLSTSLVSDFRAIMSALEKQRKEEGGEAFERPLVSAPTVSIATAPSSDLPISASPDTEAATPRDGLPENGAADAETAQPVRAAAPGQRPFVPERRTLKPHSEMRSMITALGDVRGMVPDRRAPAERVSPSTGRSEAAAPELTTAPRRRAFGTNSDSEAGTRRRRSASKDVITWQRLGVLAIFMAAVGGGASLLQSVVGRDEAKVSADAIGNAAIASVAPSQGLPMPMPNEPAPLAHAEPARVASAPAAPALRSAVPASTVNNVMAASLSASGLASAGGSGFAPALPASVSAFAAPDVVSASPMNAPALPKQAPLPPPKQVAAVVPQAQVTRNESADEPADDASATAAPFGGAPVDTVTIRSSVTMRAAPRKGAKPIGNIPSGRKVDLVACTSWCEVISDGKRGFIYKSFIGASASKDAAAVEDEAASETVTQ